MNGCEGKRLAREEEQCEGRKEPATSSGKGKCVVTRCKFLDATRNKSSNTGQEITAIQFLVGYGGK